MKSGKKTGSEILKKEINHFPPPFSHIFRLVEGPGEGSIRDFLFLFFLFNNKKRRLERNLKKKEENTMNSIYTPPPLA